VIAVFSLTCIIGVFIAGHLLGVHTTVAVIMLGCCVAALGTLIAAAETRGFEGQRIVNLPMPLTWEKLFLNVVRMAIDRGKVAGTERVYVMTKAGAVPVTGVFTARINHELSLVLDTEALSEPELNPTTAV